MTTIKMKPLAQACAFALTAGVLSQATAATTPAGTVISNQVIATYKDKAGKTYTDKSNVIEMSIREVRSATLSSGNGATQKVPTTTKTVYSTHTLKNTGNVKEVYTLTASNAKDDTLDASMKIYLDKDGSGDLSAAELKAGAITKVTLERDKMAKLVVVTTLPQGIKATDKLHITLVAQDSKGNKTKVNDVRITFKGTTDTNVTDVKIMPPTGNAASCNAYAWIKQDMTIDQAIAHAKTRYYKGKQGHIVTINSAEENAFLVQSILSKVKNGRWLIGTKPGKNGKYTQWVTGEAMSYTNWMKGQPSGDIGAAEIFQSGQWNDIPGNYKRHYIVEFEMGGCITPPPPPGGTKAPKLDITLQAAKDANCDAKIEGKFGDVKLENMAPGECAVMRTFAKNVGTAIAKSVSLDTIIPDYASYIPGSLRSNGKKLTDKIKDADKGYYDSKTGKVHFNLGDLPVGKTSWPRQYRVKID